MDAAQKKLHDDLKKKIVEMLDDPTVDIQAFAGMKETTKDGDETESYEPTGGKTIVISVGGGANNVEINRVKIDGDD